MRVLLINPPSIRERESIMLPIGLGCIATSLRRNSRISESRLIDLNLLHAEMQTTTECIDYIQQAVGRIEPDVIGFTTLCNTYPFVLECAKEIKAAHDAHIVLGGVQATLTAKETMDRFPWVDAIVKHEGEVTFNEYLDALCSNASLENIPGIVYRDAGGVHETTSRPLIPNLDDLPGIDYAVFEMQRYFDLYKHFSVAVEVGRGCPYDCSFCSTSVMWGRSCRMRSPAKVLAEIRQLHAAHGFEYFELTQDNFTSFKTYVMELCDQFKDEAFQWGCYSRCDTITPDLLEAMSEAGCSHIFYGVETGSDRMQKEIKKNLRLQRKEQTIQDTIEHGMQFTTSYIVGFPEETLSDFRKTLQHALKDAALGAKRVLLSVLSPLPCTEVYDRYRNDLIDPRDYTNDVSPLTYVSDAMRDHVRRYHDVFSSFHFIKHPSIDIESMMALKNFALLIIDNYARTFYLLLECLNQDLVYLYDVYEKVELKDGALDDRLRDLISSLPLDLSTKKILFEIFAYEDILRSLRTQAGSGYNGRRLSDMRGGRTSMEETSLLKSPLHIHHRFQFDISSIIHHVGRVDAQTLIDSATGSEDLLFVNYDDEITTFVVDEAVLAIMKGFETPKTLSEYLVQCEANGKTSVCRVEAMIAEMVDNGLLYLGKGGGDDVEN